MQIVMKINVFVEPDFLFMPVGTRTLPCTPLANRTGLEGGAIIELTVMHSLACDTESYL